MIEVPFFGRIHPVVDVLVPAAKLFICVPVAIFYTAIGCCCPAKPKKKKVRIVIPYPVEKILTPEELAQAEQKRLLAESLREKVGRIVSGEGNFPDNREKKQPLSSHSYHAGYTLNQRVEEKNFKFSRFSTTPPIDIPKTKDQHLSDEEDFFEIQEQPTTRFRDSWNASDDLEL